MTSTSNKVNTELDNEIQPLKSEPEANGKNPFNHLPNIVVNPFSRAKLDHTTLTNVEFSGLNYTAEKKVYKQDVSIIINASKNQISNRYISEKFWNVPLENPCFAGRTTVLEKIDRSLTLFQNKYFVCYGQTGIGKTEIAIEYAWRSYKAKKYKFVCWFSASNYDELAKGYIEFAQSEEFAQFTGKRFYELSSHTDKTSKEIIQDILKHLEANIKQPWLLIFDNVGTHDFSFMDFMNYVPKKGGSILITTLEKWSELPCNTDASEEIIEFNDEEAKECIEKLNKSKLGESQENINELFEKTGKFPLMLAQACNYLSNYLVSIKEYLVSYNKHLLSTKTLKISTHEHESVFTTYFHLFSVIKKESYGESALRILYYCSFFHNIDIPKPALRIFFANPNEFLEALSLLNKYFLIKQNPKNESITLHTLVHNVVTELVTHQIDRNAVFYLICAALNNEYKNKIFNEKKSYYECLYLMSHAKKMIVIFEGNPTLKEHANEKLCEFIYLQNHLALTCQVLSEYKAAETYLNNIKSFIKNENIPKREEIANAVLINLANIYDREGNTDTKIGELSKLIKELNHDDFIKSVAMTNLAIAYGECGKYAEKKELLDKAQAILTKLKNTSENSLISIDKTYLCSFEANILNEIGNIYRWEAKNSFWSKILLLNKGREQLENALRIKNGIHGDKSFLLVPILKNLALVCHELGDYKQRDRYVAQTEEIIKQDYKSYIKSEDFEIFKKSLEENQPNLSNTLVSYVSKPLAYYLNFTKKPSKEYWPYNSSLALFYDSRLDQLVYAGESFGTMKRRRGKGVVNNFEGKLKQALFNLNNNDLHVRRNAVLILGDLKKDKLSNSVIQALVYRLSDNSSYVKQSAAEVLIQLGRVNDAVIKTLIANLNTNDLILQQSAIRALEKLGKADAPEVMQAYIKNLNNENKEFAQTVARELVEWDKVDHTLISTLIEKLDNKNLYSRHSAAEALLQLCKASDKVTPVLLEQLNHNNLAVVYGITEILDKLDTVTPAVIKIYESNLNNPSVEIQLRSAQALLKLGRVTNLVVNSLIKASDDNCSIIRQIVVKILATIEKPDFLVVETLLARLTDPDSDVRQSAAEALGKLSKANETVISALFKVLDDESSIVRQAVVEALIKLKAINNSSMNYFNIEYFGKRDSLSDYSNELKMIIGILLKNLSDSYPWIRQRAIVALTSLGKDNEHIIQAMIECLDDNDVTVRQYAVEALVRLGNVTGENFAKGLKKLNKARTPETVQALMNCLSDSNSKTRQRTIEVLIELGEMSDKIVQTLLKNLKDDNSWTIQKAIESLGKLTHASDDVITALIKCLNNTDSNIYRSAIDTLEKLGKAHRPEVIEAHISNLNNSNAWIRRDTAEKLSQLDHVSEEVVQALFNNLNDSDDWVRQAIAEALIKLNYINERVIRILIKNLAVNNPYIINVATKALKKLNKAHMCEAIQAHVRNLSNSDAEIRQVSAETLIELDNISYTSQIVQALAKNLANGYTNEKARQMLIKLDKAKAPEVIQLYIKDLNEGDSKTKQKAVEVLRKLDKTGSMSEVIQAYVRALHDSDPTVSQYAAETLISFGDTSEDVLQALFKNLTTDDSKVKQSAMKMLKELGKLNASEVVQAHINNLNDNDFDIRETAINELKKLPKPSDIIVQTFIDSLSNDCSYVRRIALEILHKWNIADSDAIVQAHVNNLNNGTFQIKEEAARALGELGKTDPVILDALRKNLTVEDFWVRRRVAEVLIKLGETDQPIIDALIRNLHVGDALVRQDAAETLIALGKREQFIIDTLKENLNAVDSLIGNRAATALNKLNISVALKPENHSNPTFEKADSPKTLFFVENKRLVTVEQQINNLPGLENIPKEKKARYTFL